MPHNFIARGESNGSPHVFLAIPSYGPMPGGTVYSLWNAQVALRAAGIRVDLHLITGHCHVDDARNDLVRAFLETDAEMLIFIDADIGFDAVDLVKLIRHDRDIVAGGYPLKQDPLEFPIRPIPGEIWSDKDGLVEVEGVPTGFLKIRRRVLELLAAEAEQFHARRDLPGRRKIPVVFERAVIQSGRWSGDYNFCRKARGLGYKIYVDPEMELTHSGENHWAGSLGAYWRRLYGVTDQRFADALKAVRAGTEGPEEFLAFAEKWGNSPWVAGDGLLTAWIPLARETAGPILEVGSGLSSLLAAAANPDAQVWALEHDREWAERVRAAAEEHGLSNLTVVRTPLVDGWYAVPDTMPKHYSLILVDGPPHSEGRNNRAGLVNAGFDLAGSTVVWDDMFLEVMRDMARRISAIYGAEPHFFKHPTKDFAIARLGDLQADTGEPVMSGAA